MWPPPLQNFHTHTWERVTSFNAYITLFLPRCVECQRGLATIKMSVCPSVCQTRDLWQNERNVCQHSYTKANSAFHPSGVGKWVPASAGKAKAGMAHSVSGWTRNVQVKLWDPLRTRAITERLSGVHDKAIYKSTFTFTLPFDNTTPIYLIIVLWKLGLHFLAFFTENIDNKHRIFREFHER